MKKIKGKGILVFISAFFIFTSCSRKIIPGKPSISATEFKFDSLPNSEINIPIQVSLQPLYALAEKNVDTVFTSPDYPDKWIQQGCAIRYKYTFRRGPLQMKVSGTTLNLGFTFFYKVIGSTRPCINGIAISPWTPPCKCGFNEGERKVNVSFSNTFKIQPDYKIKLIVKRPEPQPLNKCEVCLWGQDITRQVMNNLKEELDSAKNNIENSYGTLDLRPRFQQVWDQLNKVYSIYGLGWLQINPQQIRINNIFARNDSLNVYIGLSAKPVISFEKPVEQINRVPDIVSFGSKPGFNIFLDAVLHYDSLSKIMNQQLKDKEFDVYEGPVKKIFIIEKCKLSGDGNEKLVIRVDFTGSADGTAYFTGKPFYDQATHIIEIRDIDFDVKTKDKFLKTARWLFNKKIINEISEQAKFDLSSFLDTIKLNMNRQLNQEWAKGMHSYGNIDKINLAGIYPQSQFLIIRTNCSGLLFIQISSDNFGL